MRIQLLELSEGLLVEGYFVEIGPIGKPKCHSFLPACSVSPTHDKKETEEERDPGVRGKATSEETFHRLCDGK